MTGVLLTCSLYIYTKAVQGLNFTFIGKTSKNCLQEQRRRTSRSLAMTVNNNIHFVKSSTGRIQF